MRRYVTPLRLVAALVGALIVTFLVLLRLPSSDYILLPDTAHPVAPLVHVQGGHTPAGTGEILFVDVFERRAHELETIFPWLHHGATLVPSSAVISPGESDQAARQADLRAMQVSQETAAAVALRRLGYKVTAKPSGVVVDAIELDSHAAGVLQAGDVIDAVDGVQTATIASLRSVLAKVKPGQVVSLHLHRGGTPLTVHVKTIADPLTKGRAIVGFTPDQAADIHLPLKVSIDAGNVGGPSAGLAFTLELLAQLGHDPTHGYKVAATGQIELNGAVTAIGGVKQKTYGVRDAGADVFLVPVDGGNAATAKRYAGSLRIIPVTSVSQAIRALAKLPPKH
ncbi:MAG: S16 family serine protease [Actinomycetota bacterium]